MTTVFMLLLLQAGRAPAQARSFEQLSQLAESARQADRNDEALRIYREALRLKPSWADGWWNVGSILYENEKYADARDAFRKLIAIDSKAVAGYALLGICEYKTAEYDSAMRHLDAARILGMPNTNPVGKAALYYLALLVNKRGLHDFAAGLLLATPEKKVDPPAMLAIGLTGLRIAKLPEELTDSEKDLAGKVGQALAAPENEAVSQIRELLKLYPDHPNLHYLYGMVLLHGDSGLAIEEFQRELAIQPTSVPALLAIAHEKERRTELDEARTYAERAVAADPSDFAPHAMLGRILASQGRVEEGAAELEKARDIDSSSPQVYFALASAYARLGRNEDAEKARAEFLRLKKMADEQK